MQPTEEYRKLLTEVIQKQIVILGAAIVLAKARNVGGLTLTDDGTVSAIKGDPAEITRQLVEQFSQLSTSIAAKISESLGNKPELLVDKILPTVLQDKKPDQTEKATATSAPASSTLPDVDSHKLFKTGPIENSPEVTQPAAAEASEPLQPAPMPVDLRSDPINHESGADQSSTVNAEVKIHI